MLRDDLERLFREGAPDEFGEVRASHRYFDEWCRRYHLTEVLARVREDSGPTFGLRELVRFDPVWAPLVFFLEGNGYLQRPDDALVAGDERVEGSALFRGWVTQYRELTPELAHVPRALVFGRLLSREEVGYLPGRVDQDVFTRYKAEHQAGLELSDTLVYRPWLDTYAWGRAALLTNEDFVTVDRLTAWVGWKQRVGDLQVDLAYEPILFLRDEDRPRSTVRHLLDLQVTGCLWPCGLDRVEVGAGWQRDLTRNQDSISVFLAWHFGNGRRFRDFRPDEVDFRDLRERRAAEMLRNNHVWHPE